MSCLKKNGSRSHVATRLSRWSFFRKATTTTHPSSPTILSSLDQPFFSSVRLLPSILRSQKQCGILIQQHRNQVLSTSYLSPILRSVPISPRDLWTAEIMDFLDCRLSPQNAFTQLCASTPASACTSSGPKCPDIAIRLELLRHSRLTHARDTKIRELFPLLLNLADKGNRLTLTRYAAL